MNVKVPERITLSRKLLLHFIFIKQGAAFLTTGCPAKHVPLVFVNFSACKSHRIKKNIFCDGAQSKHTSKLSFPSCIKDKDNDQRANKAEIKTLKYQC